MDSEIKQWLGKREFFDFDGHKIFYLQEVTGKNLLLIHNYPESSFEWKAVWAKLICWGWAFPISRKLTNTLFTKTPKVLSRW